MTQHAYGPAPGAVARRKERMPARGCIPLRPLGLADILDGSFRAIRRNPVAVFSLAAVLAVLRTTLTAALELGAYRLVTTTQLELIDIFIISSVLGTVLTGVLTLVVTQDVLGVSLTARDAVIRLRGRVWALLGLAVVVTALETLGLVAMGVAGVWLWGLWAVVVPVMVVERSTLRGALSRSRHLVSGLWWRVWGIRALGFLLANLLGVLVTLPFLLLAGEVSHSGFLPDAASGLSVVYVLITSVGAVLSSTLTAPIKAGIDALLYVDLRMRREGLDIVLLQARLAPHLVATPTQARTAF